MKRLLVAIVFLPALAHAQPRPPELPADVPLADDERRQIEAVFVEEEPLLGATALVPRGDLDALGRARQLVASRPSSPAAQATLAEAAWRVGDFAAAEAAWRAAAALAPKAAWPLLALADFHAGRLQPQAELADLAELENLVAAEDRQALHARALAVIDRHALPLADERRRHQRALVDLRDDDTRALAELVDERWAAGDRAGARAELTRFCPSHPELARGCTRIASELDVRQGQPEAAVARWRKLLAGAPLADDIEARYFDYFAMLSRLDLVAEEKARTTDLVPRFNLALAEGEAAAARALLAHLARPISDEEALLHARLYVRVGDRLSALRLYHALAAGAADRLREPALVELGALLLADDLGRVGLTALDPLDVLAADRWDTGPSLPGGLLSLALEGYRFASAGDGLGGLVAAWQNGQRAGSLLDDAWKKKPSPRIRTLALAVLRHHEAWGNTTAHDALAERMLTAWPASSESVEAALAAARTSSDRTRADRWWKRSLAAGEKVSASTAARVRAEWVRSLLATRRAPEAIALLWADVDAHPNDPAAYERLLDVVSGAKLFDQELRVYERALARLPGRGWLTRLARYKLRHEGETNFRRFVTDVIARLPGAEVEAHLGELRSVTYSLEETQTRQLYEAFYKAALARFPLRLSFVHRLLALYEQPQGGDAKAAFAVLARYAPLDPGLRGRLVTRLAREGRVDSTIAGLGNGPAARLLRADLAVWRSRQEDALIELRALGHRWPHDLGLGQRRATLELTHGERPDDQGSARAAVAHWDGLAIFYPGDAALLDSAGSTLAEVGDVDGARARWKRILAARPGDPAAHLQVAAAAWDYRLYADSAAELVAARQLGKNPLLYWDRLGGVHESRGDRAAAAGEYARAWIDEIEAELAAAKVTKIWQEYDDHEGEYRHQAERTPGEALATLAKRDGDKKIDAAFAAEAKKRGRDFRPVYALARWQEAHGQPDAGRATRRSALGRFADPAFLDRLAVDAAGSGDHELRLAALTRRADLGQRAPERLERLAAALEDAGKPADAEKIWTELLASPKASPAAFFAFAEFLDRRARTADSLVARARGADKLAGTARREARRALAHRYAAATRADDARLIFIELRKDQPEDLDALAGLAALGDADQVFAAALREAKALPGARAAANRQAVRRLWIRHLEGQGQHAPAMEQWIAAVNAAPEDSTAIAEAVAYGQRHAVLARLEAHLQKTVTASPKDHRFPILLAALLEASGRFAEAAEAYQKSLAVRPDRVDLHARRAAALFRGGKPAEAAVAYRRAFELSDEDEQYLLPEARALLAAGKPADQTITLWLDRSVRLGPARFAEAAAVLENAGHFPSALPLLRRALTESLAGENSWVDEESLTRLLATGLKAGQGEKIVAELVAQRDNFPEPEQVDRVLAWQLPGLVVLDGLDDDARLLRHAEAAARRLGEGAIGHLGERLGELGEVSMALRLLDEEAAGSDRDHQRRRFRRSGQELLVQRKADRLVVDRALANDQLRTSELIGIAIDAAVRLGDAAAERKLLELAIADQGGGFADRSPLVTRYLARLAADQDEQGLLAAAGRAGSHAGQIIGWLFAHGRADLALLGVDASAAKKQRSERWRLGAGGLTVAQLYPGDPRAAPRLDAVLARKPIGELLAGAGDAAGGKIADGKPRARLAMRYAAVLAVVPRKDLPLAALALSDAEARPGSDSAQIAAGRLFLAAKQYPRAEEQFRAALAIGGKEPEALDGLATARLRQGDRDGALKLWASILDGSHTAASFHAEALVRASLGAEGRAALLDHLTRSWAKLDAISGPRVIERYAGLFPDQRAGGDFDRALQKLASGDHRPFVAPAVLAVIDDDGRAAWLERDADAAWARGDHSGNAEQALIERWLADGKWAAAEARIGKLRPSIQAFWLERAAAHARLAGKDVAGATALMTARLERSLDPGEAAEARRLFVAMNHPREGAALVARFHETLRPLPALDFDSRLAWADARLTLDDVARARSILDGGLVEANAEDLPRAADLLSRHGRARDALVYREAARRLFPGDGAHRIALARDHFAAGEHALALDTAIAVLGDRGLSRAWRQRAAELIDAWIALDPAVKPQNLLEKRAKASGFDVPTQLALAAAGDSGALDRAVEKGHFVAPVHAARGDRGGRDALAHFDRAAASPGEVPRFAYRRFLVARAAGQHAAAVGALAGDTADLLDPLAAADSAARIDDPAAEAVFLRLTEDPALLRRAEAREEVARARLAADERRFPTDEEDL